MVDCVARVSLFEGGEEVPAPAVPRKLATSKYGVDPSVIDKGDHNDFTETNHADGKVILPAWLLVLFQKIIMLFECFLAQRPHGKLL